MSPILHGSSAFTHSPDCGCCVNKNVYRDRPSVHTNVESPTMQGCSISIDVYLAAPKDVDRYRYFAKKGKRTRLFVDSGATHSICRSDVADGLGIQRDEITKGRRKRFKLLPGSSQVCCQYDLCVRLGNIYQDFSVYWAVELTQEKTPEGIVVERRRLLDDVPYRGNLLGMTDILTSNMLCLTPEKLFVFPVRKAQTERRGMEKKVTIPIKETRVPGAKHHRKAPRA